RDFISRLCELLHIRGSVFSRVKCETAHTRSEKSSVRCESEGAIDSGYCIQSREGNMPAISKILTCAALTTGLLLQASPCRAGDPTKFSGTWNLVAFMTEDITNKVRENVCDKQAEGYLTFTDAGRVFGFAATKGGEALASTPMGYNASLPIISYSGNYRVEE